MVTLVLASGEEQLVPKLRQSRPGPTCTPPPRPPRLPAPGRSPHFSQGAILSHRTGLIKGLDSYPDEPERVASVSLPR